MIGPTKSEEGASLLGLVLSVVLLLVLGVGAFYGYGKLDSDKPRVSLGESSKLSVDSSVVSSTLRMDLSGANAVRNSPSASGIDIARTDGSCVSWKLVGKDMLRASALNASTEGQEFSTVSSGVATGNFSLTQDSVTLDLRYSNGQSINERVPRASTSQGGGPCW